MLEHLRNRLPALGTGMAFGLVLCLDLLLVWQKQVQSFGVAGRPLPWDMAAPYERALLFADALKSLEFGAVWDQWFAASQYPPLHSALLGAWFCIFGSGPASWILAVAILHAVTIALVFRVDVVGAVALVSLATVTALAPTLMVEPLAALLLVLALMAAARSVEVPSVGRWTVSALAMTLVLLTKYNFGLPLLAAVPLVGAASRDRRTFASSVLAASLAFSIWVGYLQLQDRGWEYFLQFATNRSNAGDMSTAEKAAWYGHVFRSEFLRPAWAVIPAFLLASWGTMRRRPLALLGASYALLSFAALVRHDYLLVRNLVAPSVALVMVVAAGARELRARPSGEWFRLAVAGVVSVGAVASLPAWERANGKFLVSPDRELVRLSSYLSHQFEEESELRILGSFEQFGAGWVKILARRSRGHPVVRLDWPYPGREGATRSGRSARWNPSYLATLQDWAPHGEARVVAISLAPHSPYCNDGYRLWTEWTTNYVRQLPWTGWYLLEEEREFANGVRLETFERLEEPLRFEEGWGEVESWGRWAHYPRATLVVPPTAGRVDLVFSTSIPDEFVQGQDVRVTVDGRCAWQEHLDARPWSWSPRAVALEESPHCQRIEFEFASRFETPGGRQLALAVEWLGLVRRANSEASPVRPQHPNRLEQTHTLEVRRVDENHRETSADR